MIIAGYKNKSGFAIIPDYLPTLPLSSENLEFICTSKKESGVIIYNDQDLKEARLGKKRYHCWQDFGRYKKNDYTRTYWARSDDEAIDFFCNRYHGETIIVCNSKCVEIWLSEGPCNKKRRMVQISLF